MITQEMVDKISNEFGSTFFFLPPNHLGNVFHWNEMSRVAALIRKHIPGVNDVAFEQREEVSPGLFIYSIEVL